MNLVNFIKNLFQPTPADQSAWRNDMLKLGGIAAGLIIAHKSGNIVMSDGFQNVLQYICVICGTSAAHAQSQVVSTPSAPATNDGPAAS